MTTKPADVIRPAPPAVHVRPVERCRECDSARHGTEAHHVPLIALETARHALQAGRVDEGKVFVGIAIGLLERRRGGG